MQVKTTSRHAALCALTAALLLAGGVRAAEDAPAEDAPAPPDSAEDPAASTTGQQGEAGQPPPPVRAHRREAFGQTITEYSRGGRVFLMTVKPRVGPTQYWDDPDGDGQFQRSTSDNIDENLNLPKWKLGGW